MKLTWAEGKGILLTPILFALFMFFIPISPSLKSIFFAGGVIAVLLTPYYNQYIPYAFNSLWGRMALVLLVFTAIACLWSPAPFAMQMAVVGKYAKLIYLPVIAVGFIHPRVRFLTINSYLAAMVLTCIISILQAENIIVSGDPGEVFYNHIITGFMIAFGSYLAGLFVFQYKGWIQLAYLSLVLLMSYQIFFINTGRTGYVVYFILMSFLLLQKLNVKKAMIGLMLLSGLVAVIYHESPTMHGRVHDLITDVRALEQNNPNTSLGYRIQFHNYARSLWLKHPIVGTGTGGFKYSFSHDNPVPVWGSELTDPHSQYWMTLSEHGLIGIVLFVLFVGSLLLTSFQLTETRPIIWGILISFCIGSFSDTILCYSTVGYLLIVMSALCFGELIEKRVLINRQLSQNI